jgi:hypothetical protein
MCLVYTVYSDFTVQVTYYHRTKQPYNILDYIAILHIGNTIFCNTSELQYNILQYLRRTLQYIAIVLKDKYW